MALIKCPECGREISDKAEICIGCGFPIKEHLHDFEEKHEEECEENFTYCKFCGERNEKDADYCEACGMRITPYSTMKNKKITFLEPDRRNREPEVTGIARAFMRNSPPEKKADPFFKGIYKYTLFGEKKEVYCPRCHSTDCSWYTEQRYVPGKTKTRYTANLNPFHPFTLVNKKEKIVRKEQTYTQKKIMCNSCGFTFY